MIDLDYINFLNLIFQSLKIRKIDVSGLMLDHIGYRASTSDEFEELKSEFSNLGFLDSEHIVDGRRVAVFGLNHPIMHNEYVIPAIELIEPKINQIIQAGLEHVEFVLTNTFEDFISLYPTLPWDKSTMDRKNFSHLKLPLNNNLSVKLHLKSILD